MFLRRLMDARVKLGHDECACFRDLAGRAPRGLHEHPALSNQRAQGIPGARCTRGLVCKTAQKNAHEHTGSAEAIRHSLRNGFTAYTCSPATGLSCHRRPRKLPFANLMPASGHQDHTILPSASRAVRQERIRGHRIPPRVRDDREPPLSVGRDGYSYSFIWIS